MNESLLSRIFGLVKAQRIHLTPLSAKDLPVFVSINTHPHVRKFLWDDSIVPTETLVEILEKVESHFAKDNWGLWKIILSGSETVIGYAGLWPFFDEQQPQLLYALLPEYTGKGYATEASQLVIEYSFQALRFSRLIASMDKGNIDSVKVCERLGFRFVEEKTIEAKPTLFYELRLTTL